MKVGVIVGSLRKESFNRKMANALIDLAPSSLEMEILDISGLSFYNQDFDEAPPADWIDFRRQIRDKDAILFVTPEYNRSIPGVLKNAIDIGSRPYGQSAWDSRPAAVISVSVGAIGGFGANHHLRQCLTYLNMPCMGQPEAYIGNAGSLFTAEGKIAKADTVKFAEDFLKAFARWVETHRPESGMEMEPRKSKAFPSEKILI
jgi:chromate reductase